MELYHIEWPAGQRFYFEGKEQYQRAHKLMWDAINAAEYDGSQWGFTIPSPESDGLVENASRNADGWTVDGRQVSIDAGKFEQEAAFMKQLYEERTTDDYVLSEFGIVVSDRRVEKDFIAIVTAVALVFVIFFATW